MERSLIWGETMKPRKSRTSAPPEGLGDARRIEVEALEHAVHHETTQHAPKLHAQQVKAPPLDPRSQQRRFPR
jgi:hypothetical protein